MNNKRKTHISTKEIAIKLKAEYPEHTHWFIDDITQWLEVIDSMFEESRKLPRKAKKKRKIYIGKLLLYYAIELVDALKMAYERAYNIPIV